MKVWTKPKHGWDKLNTDASFSADDCTGAWGAVLRNDQGDVIKSAWGFLPHCPNVLTAEALGMLLGVREVIPVYAGPLQIESDNLMLVNELKASWRSKSQVADIVQDIGNSTQLLSEVVFRKINRTANEVANALAKLGQVGLTEGMVLGQVPPCVVDRLNHDCKHDTSIVS